MPQAQSSVLQTVWLRKKIMGIIFCTKPHFFHSVLSDLILFILLKKKILKVFQPLLLTNYQLLPILPLLCAPKNII